MEKERHKHELDRLVSQKLEGLQPDFDPGSWDKLQQRLDREQASAAPDAWDALVRERLQRVNTPYERRSWQRLALRLELEYRRTQSVLHGKTMELAVAALLLLIYWQIPTGIGLPLPATPTPATNQKTMPAAAVPATPTAPAPAVQPAATSVAPSRPVAQADSQPTSLQPAAVVLSPPTPAASATSALAQLPLLPAEPATEESATHPRTLLTKTPPPPSPSDAWIAAGPVAALGDSPLGRLDYGSLQELTLAIKPVQRRTFLRIGFVGGPDYNRVVTPPTAIGFDTVVALDRYSLGYHGGITFGVESGRFEVETGMIYAARNYSPVPVLYVTGSLREGYAGTGFRDFELNTANVPLLVRYNFFLRDKWRLYVLSGASLNLVLQANYYTVSESAFFNTSFIQPPDSDGARNAASLPASVERRLTKGWFEGGSFWDNATFYGNVGMGVERYMTSRWTLFAQPTYQHLILDLNGGMGPYRDRIHTMSVLMGVKVRL